MVPVTVHTVVSAPREQVFAYVNDLADREAFCDHYMEELHLTRPRSTGVGAAARFRLRAPRRRTWAETRIVESDYPRRIVEEGRMGRLDRTRWWTVWELSRVGEEATRVELTTAIEPATRLDSLRESFGARRWFRRKTDTSLRRLRQVFEERPERPLARATVAGYESEKAVRFGS